MSTSNKTPLTNAHFSEEQLIGTSVLVVLSLALPIVLEGSLLLSAIVGAGAIMSGLATVIGRMQGYTTRAQARVLLGGTILTITATVVGFTTTPFVGGVFLITASALILFQLAVTL